MYNSHLARRQRLRRCYRRETPAQSLQPEHHRHNRILSDHLRAGELDKSYELLGHRPFRRHQHPSQQHPARPRNGQKPLRRPWKQHQHPRHRRLGPDAQSDTRSRTSRRTPRTSNVLLTDSTRRTAGDVIVLSPCAAVPISIVATPTPCWPAVGPRLY